MTAKEIFDFIIQHRGIGYIAIFLLMSLIEISPIKVNPLGWIVKMFKKLLKWIGKSTNSNLTENVERTTKTVSTLVTSVSGLKEVTETATDNIHKLKTDLDATNTHLLAAEEKLISAIDLLSNRVEESEMTTARTRILRFSDEIAHGKEYSREYYEQVLRDCDTYEAYCKTHKDFVNNVASASIAFVRSDFESALKEHRFH